MILGTLVHVLSIFFICLKRAGKNEDGDNINQPVRKNEDNLSLQCKEDWEESWTPSVSAPDHIPPSAIKQEQKTAPTITGRAYLLERCQLS